MSPFLKRNGIGGYFFGSFFSLLVALTATPSLVGAASLSRGTSSVSAVSVQATTLDPTFSDMFDVGSPACNSYYIPSSVKISLLSQSPVSHATSTGTTTLGYDLSYTATIQNNNPYPLVDSSLYLLVSPSGTVHTIDSLNDWVGDAIATYAAADNIYVDANASKTVTFHIQLPVRIAAGTYEIRTKLVSANKVQLTDSMAQPEARFTIHPPVNPTATPDITISAPTLTTYSASSSAPTTVTLTVKNNSAQTVSAPVVSSTYLNNWLGGKPLESQMQLVTIPAHGSKNVTFVLHIKVLPTLLLATRISDRDQGAVHVMELKREGSITPPNIYMAGLLAYPVDAPQKEVNVVACFANLVGPSALQTTLDYKADVTLLNKDGGVIDTDEQEVSASSSTAIVNAVFSSSTASQVASMRVDLFRNRVKIDTVSLLYYHPAPLSATSTTPYTSPEFLALWIILIIIFILLVNLSFYGYRHQGFSRHPFIQKVKSLFKRGSGKNMSVWLLVLIGSAALLMSHPYSAEASTVSAWQTLGRSDLDLGTYKEYDLDQPLTSTGPYFNFSGDTYLGMDTVSTFSTTSPKYPGKAYLWIESDANGTIVYYDNISFSARTPINILYMAADSADCFYPTRSDLTSGLGLIQTQTNDPSVGGRVWYYSSSGLMNGASSSSNGGYNYGSLYSYSQGGPTPATPIAGTLTCGASFSPNSTNTVPWVVQLGTKIGFVFTSAVDPELPLTSQYSIPYSSAVGQDPNISSVKIAGSGYGSYVLGSSLSLSPTQLGCIQDAPTSAYGDANGTSPWYKYFSPRTCPYNTAANQSVTGGSALRVTPPALSISGLSSHFTCTPLQSDGTMECTATSIGTSTPVFTVGDSFARSYRNGFLVKSGALTWYPGSTATAVALGAGTSTAPDANRSGAIHGYASTYGDGGQVFTFPGYSVSPQSISVVSPPPAPVVTVVKQGDTEHLFTFSVKGTDPNNYPIYYQIKWKSDDGPGQWTAVTNQTEYCDQSGGYYGSIYCYSYATTSPQYLSDSVNPQVPSGTALLFDSQAGTYDSSFATGGPATFWVRTVDISKEYYPNQPGFTTSDRMFSPWATTTVNVPIISTPPQNVNAYTATTTAPQDGTYGGVTDASSSTACGGKIDITWDAVSGATEYRVYRYNQDTMMNDLVGTTSDLVYRDTLGENPEYSNYAYQVTSYSAEGGESDAQYYASADPSSGCYAPPQFPNGAYLVVTSSSTCGGKIDISWTPLDGAAGYHLYRLSYGSNSTLVASTTGTSFTDNVNDPNEGYDYYLTAYNQYGEGYGIWGGGMTSDSCNSHTCGNNICEVGENINNCPQDCGSSCGNGICEAGEDSISCPIDCNGSSSCTRDNMSIANQASQFFYSQREVPVGSTCSGTLLTCSDGILSDQNGTPDSGVPPAYPYSYCRISPYYKEI